MIKTTKQQEDTLIKNIQNENSQDAWLKLYKLLHPLIFEVASYYLNQSMQRNQIISAGKRGLKKAAFHYDGFTKDYKFSTYAVWWIKDAIEKATKTIAAKD